MDPVVSASTGALQLLLPKLANMVNEEYQLHKGVKDGIKYIHKELGSMQAALEKVSDAPADKVDKQVKIWANELRDMSYDIEDTIDSYMVQVDVAAAPSDACCINVRSMLPRTYNARRGIANDIKRIKEEVREVYDRRNRCKVDDSFLVTPAPTSDLRHLQARYKDVSKLVGIDSSQEELTRLLSMEAESVGASEKKLKLVSIFGSGGMGKTTLANVLYQKFKEHFDCAAFVSVSLNPDIKSILSAILRQVKETSLKKNKAEEEENTVEEEKNKHVNKAKVKSTRRQESQRNYENTREWSVEEVVEKIRDILEDKRYFIVIDDIWDKSAWETMKYALVGNNNGSKIITTTRYIDVAESCRSFDNVDVIIHELQPLSNVDSEKLFYHTIFGEDSCPPELKEVSQKILKRCHGWPLAIITVASLLANKGTHPEDEWYHIYDSIHSGHDSSDDVQTMRHILSLSYYDLPRELKTCCLYLTMFPEDHIIGKDDLIWRWIAEGFVYADGDGDLYQIGENYFNKLISRSMIEGINVGPDGRVHACRVHDMVLEFFTSLLIEDNFVTILNGQRSPSQTSIRRLSLRNNKDLSTAISLPPHVRSLVVFSHAINLLPPLGIFQVLRVLDLELCSSDDIKGVGKLLLLRYLRLSHVDHSCIELPKEIGNLRFLQTMDLKEVRIEEVPSAVIQLIQLRALEVSLRKWDKRYEKLLLQWLCRLTKLRCLSIFAPDVSLDFMLQVDWVPLDLRRLTARAHRNEEHTSPVTFVHWPVLSPFTTLPKWVNSLLVNLSHLSIMVKILRQEDLGSLGGLPALLSLDLQVTAYCPKQRLEITASAFCRLAYFNYTSRAMGLVFRRGAMQRLQRLSLVFQLAVTMDTHGNFDFGWENLISLKSVVVATDCRHAKISSEVEAAEAAMRAATKLNTNHPTLDVIRYFETSIDHQEEEITELEATKIEDIAGLTKIGPCGEGGGRMHDIKVAPRRLESVTIHGSHLIEGLSFSYTDHDGKHRTAGPWGNGYCWGENTIDLEPTEFIKEVSGTTCLCTPLATTKVIGSLTLVTNSRTYGPFGVERENPFNMQAPANSSIVGFFVRAGDCVDAIGIYVHPF